MIDPKDVAVLLRDALGDSMSDSDLFLAINLWLDRRRDDDDPRAGLPTKRSS